MAKVVTYVEIDVPMCSLTFGQGACTATGAKKCFNSLGTCQVRPKFSQVMKTLRLSEATEEDDFSVDSFPCLVRADTQTTKISLGEDLGIRSSVNIVCGEFRHSDSGPLGDKYRSERAGDPFNRGSFWAKFRIRHPYLRGRPMRVYRGQLGQALSEMDVRHYTVNAVLGPSVDGTVTITGQDVLKFADGDRAQAPKPSGGFLLSDIDVNATSITLMPSGVGNLDYPSKGLVAIGGEEVCGFTRNGDQMTLVRGERNTERKEHKSGDRVQLCLEYSGWTPADIISDLLVNYANADPNLIPLQEWLTEVQAHLRRLYTRTIAEPTSVRKLISELIKQAALAVWHADTENKVKLQVLKPLPINAGTLSEDVYLEGKTQVSDQPEKRISTCQVLYGMKNPLLDSENPESYRSMALVSDIQGQSDFGSDAIEVVYATWIPAYARQVATRLGALRVGRYATAPRRVTTEVHKTAPLIPKLGEGYYFTSWNIQDEDGNPISIPVQVTNVTDMEDRVKIEAEEATFLPIEEEDLSDRTITLDGNALNLNLRQIHDTIYPDPKPTDKIRFIVPAGVNIGSRSADATSVDTGWWPSNVKPTLMVRGRIQGTGGRGADVNEYQGGRGGDAIIVRTPFKFDLAGGQVWSGGGGGAWTNEGMGGKYGGGGGQGNLGGAGGKNDGHTPWAENGTPEKAGNHTGGPTATYNSGGPAGQDGWTANSGARGGVAGRSIVGVGMVEWVSGGDVRGPQV